MKTIRKLHTISFRVPRSILSRLRRASAVQGISQTAILIRALERELWRFERELTRKMKVRQELDEQLGKDPDSME